MALYLVRAGRDGQYEKKFIEDSMIYLHWGDLFLNENIKNIGEYDKIKNAALTQCKDENQKTIINGVSQINTFVNKMNIGDLVALPSKNKPSIAIGKIVSDYQFEISNNEDFRHFRKVEWINTDIPRSKFDQDLLYSLGAFMTICQIQRNDAEERIRKLISSNFIDESKKIEDISTDQSDLAQRDYEQLAKDEIYNLIDRKFKGHALERLVEGILQAQGYHTWRTEGGPDGGMDILAAPDNLGFGTPKICIQVKSEDSLIDRPTLDRLRGSMTRSKATHGLLVSLSGFKSTVLKEIPQMFFDIRLWDKQELVNQLLKNYNNINEGLKSEIPLKQVWMVATNDYV